MAITYDAPSNTITVTGYTEGTPCTFTDVYNADVAGGWGVVSLQGTSQFLFDCKLQIGDWNTATYFADTEKNIMFADGLRTAHNIHLIRVLTYAYVRFGELTDAGLKQTNKGCTFIDLNTAAYYGSIIYTYFGNSYVYLYGCSFDATVGDIWVFANRCYNCIFQGWAYLYYSLDIFNVFITGGTYGLRYPQSGGTINNVFFLSSSTAQALWFRSTYAASATNFYCRKNGGYFIWVEYAAGTQQDYNIINADTNIWQIGFSSASYTGKVYRQYTFNFQVTDYSGTPIENATVTLKDKDSNEIFSLSTDANGDIAEQTVSKGYYDQAHGNTLQDYGPHTLTVTKAGYIPRTRVFDLTEKVDWVSSMHAQLVGDATPSEVAAGKSFYSNDADTMQTGSYVVPNKLVGDKIRVRTRTVTKKVPLGVEEPLMLYATAHLLKKRRLAKTLIEEK